MVKRRLPDTEVLAPVPVQPSPLRRRAVVAVPALPAPDWNRALAERVIHDLHKAVCAYAQDFPGCLPREVSVAVLAMYDAVAKHRDLLEQVLALRSAVSQLECYSLESGVSQAVGEARRFLRYEVK